MKKGENFIFFKKRIHFLKIFIKTLFINIYIKKIKKKIK